MVAGWIGREGLLFEVGVGKSRLRMSLTGEGSLLGAGLEEGIG